MLEDDETTCFARINRQTGKIKNEYSYGQMKSWQEISKISRYTFLLKLCFTDEIFDNSIVALGI